MDKGTFWGKTYKRSIGVFVSWVSEKQRGIQ